MSLEHKLKKNKNIISLILVSFFSLLIFFSYETEYSKKAESYLVDLVGIFYYPQKWYKNILSVKEENIILSQKLVQFSLLNSKLKNYKLENETLREMLNFKESYKYLSLLPANIVNNNFSLYAKSSIINVGRINQITNNLSVIDENGNLVGKTIRIGEKNTKIQLLSDNNFSVSVKVGKSIAQFKPTFGRFGVLEGLLKTASINKDDIIYTSGISEIYPSDIPIAKVTSFTKNNTSIFQKVDVEILVDLNNLYYVFIIQ